MSNARRRARRPSSDPLTASTAPDGEDDAPDDDDAGDVTPAPVGPRGPLDSAGYRERIMRCTDTPQRAAVLANLEADQYKREVDLQTDVAALEQLELVQRRAT